MVYRFKQFAVDPAFGVVRFVYYATPVAVSLQYIVELAKKELCLQFGTFAWLGAYRDQTLIAKINSFHLELIMR